MSSIPPFHEAWWLTVAHIAFVLDSSRIQYVELDLLDLNGEVAIIHEKRVIGTTRP